MRTRINNLITKLIKPANWTLVLLFCAFSSSVFAKTTDFSFNSSHTFYSEQDIELPFKTTLNSNNCAWAISYLSNTVVAGSAAIDKHGQGTIKMRFPKLNEGVIAKTLLTLRIANQQFQEKLYFFSPIQPEKLNRKITASIWSATQAKSLETFCQQLGIDAKTVTQVSNAESDVVIISGMNFDKHSAIFKNFANWGKDRPVKIVILPPFSGKINVSLEQASRIFMAKQDFIQTFSKIYDTVRWNNQPFVKQSFTLEPDESGKSINFNKHPGDFTFCEFRVKQATIVICSWQLANYAQTSPSARGILKSIICFNREKEVTK